MNIVHLVPNFYPAVGGTETFVHEISKGLYDQHHDVSVITNNKLRNYNKKLKKFEVIDGIKIYRVPFKLILRYNMSLEAIKLLLALDYDILHIHSIGFLTDIIPLIKSIKKCKIVVSTHGGIFHTPNISFLKKIYFKYVAKIALNYADRVIASSFNDFSLFSKICDKNKLSIVTPGINWPSLSKISPNFNNKTLLYVGRIAQNKRLDRMVNVVAEIQKSVKDIKLLLVGEDWGEKSKLTKLSKEFGVYGNIKFLGVVKEVSKYYGDSSLFLLSSEYEGFGISVIEAMAAGLPVIVNDIEAMHKIVENNKNGYIIDFDDHEKVAKLIIKLLDNKALLPKLSKYAKLSTSKYDWGRIVNYIENVYNAI